MIASFRVAACAPMVREDERPRRVLVLDEHEASAYVTRIAISALDYECETVTNASAAEAAIERFKPDVLIYEWRLGKDAGIGLGGRLRARAASYGIDLLLVVISTMDEPEGFRAREAVDAYFTKPFESAALASVIVDHRAVRPI